MKNNKFKNETAGMINGMTGHNGKDPDGGEAQRQKAAARLLKRYAGNEDICETIAGYYGTQTAAQTYGYGLLFFSVESWKETVGAEKISYDDYLDAQIRTAGKYRHSFLNCYMNIPIKFKGEIERINSKMNQICFKRIFVTGMYFDGDFFDGKEDHVWMSGEGFGKCEVGDCFSFGAEVYRYLKTGNGRMIDYSLRNPENVTKIDRYSLPTDEELALQSIDEIICETCYFSENCSRMNCMRDSKEIESLRKEMLAASGVSDKEKDMPAESGVSDKEKDMPAESGSSGKQKDGHAASDASCKEEGK